MHAQLRAHLAGISDDLEAIYGDEPKITPMGRGEGLWLDCGVIQPRSAEGRTVRVFIPPNLVPGLMKACREQMIRDREQTIAQVEQSSADTQS